MRICHSESSGISQGASCVVVECCKPAHTPLLHGITAGAAAGHGGSDTASLSIGSGSHRASRVRLLVGHTMSHVE